MARKENVSKANMFVDKLLDLIGGSDQFATILDPYAPNFDYSQNDDITADNDEEIEWYDNVANIIDDALRQPEVIKALNLALSGKRK